MLGLRLLRRMRTRTSALMSVTGIALFMLYLAGPQVTLTNEMQTPGNNRSEEQPHGSVMSVNNTSQKRANPDKLAPPGGPDKLAPRGGPSTNFSRREFHTLYYDPLSPPRVLQSWLMSKSHQCDGKFVAYGNEVALAKDIILDNSKTKGQRGGGNFYDLMNQKEDVEFFKYHAGFMEMNCISQPKYQFSNKNHLNSWMTSMIVSDGKKYDANFEGTYLAITRYEYVNLFHTMTDFYNAFLVMTFFNKTQSETNILIVDGHPWGSLDPVWETLFNSTLRLGLLPPRSKFTNFIFGQQGYNSYIFKGQPTTSNDVPLSNEFRKFFLSSYDLRTDRKLNCSSLSFLVIFRRPYMAHPRNPSGDVHRKIRNEDEIINAIVKNYPSCKMAAVQMDRWGMREQAKFASEADVMIGMHGAALSLSMVLPQHAALIELMPNYIKPAWKRHFIHMAEWRQLIYKRWYNQDASLEFPDHYTKVPPSVLLRLIEEAVHDMCPDKT